MRAIGRVLTCSIPLVLIVVGSAFADNPKSERVLGRDDDVRVEAEILADSIKPGALVRVRCTVENFRSEPIQIASVNSQSSYDADSRVVTVNVGSELPIDAKADMITVGPNEKHSFNVDVPLRLPTIATRSRAQSTVRVKLHFLDRPRAVLAKLFDDPFDQWLEAKKTVVTNAIRVSDSRSPATPLIDASSRGRTRGRGGY
jgi:hypothetical protein